MNFFHPTTPKGALMALRASLKHRLKRLLRKLYKKEPKSKGRSTIGPAFGPQTDKVNQPVDQSVDQPFRLLGLPIELLLHILEILLEDTPVKSSCHRYPLVSLRLTCKELYHLTTPLLYRIIDLNTIPGVSPNDCNFVPGSLTRTENFARQVQAVGQYIREASIRVLKPGLWSRAEDVDMAIVDFFLGAPQLRTLTINYDVHDFDQSFHSSLLKAIPHLSALKNVTLKMAEYPKGAPMPQAQLQDYYSNIANRLLTSLINHHGQSLHSINIYGGLRVNQELFNLIRDKTPNLRAFCVLMGLNIELNPILREPKPWSCVGTLRSLTIMHCTIHAEHLATQLALGTFGTLQHLSLFCCGDPSDDQSLRTKVKWKGPMLDTFRLHHFIAWEVDTLSVISTRLLVATSVEPPHFSALIRNSNSFPGVERIRVSSKWGVGELVDLQKAAASRGIEVIPDWDRSEDSLAEEFRLIGPCPCLDCVLNKLRL